MQVSWLFVERRARLRPRWHSLHPPLLSPLPLFPSSPPPLLPLPYPTSPRPRHLRHGRTCSFQITKLTAVKTCFSVLLVLTPCNSAYIFNFFYCFFKKQILICDIHNSRFNKYILIKTVKNIYLDQITFFSLFWKLI